VQLGKYRPWLLGLVSVARGSLAVVVVASQVVMLLFR
jgi:hypothetical protein